MRPRVRGGSRSYARAGWRKEEEVAVAAAALFVSVQTQTSPGKQQTQNIDLSLCLCLTILTDPKSPSTPITSSLSKLVFTLSTSVVLALLSKLPKHLEDFPPIPLCPRRPIISSIILCYHVLFSQTSQLFLTDLRPNRPK